MCKLEQNDPMHCVQLCVFRAIGLVRPSCLSFSRMTLSFVLQVEFKTHCFAFIKAFTQVRQYTTW